MLSPSQASSKNLNILPKNGYSLVGRDRNQPYSRWRDHHLKEFSKVNPERLCLLELGVLPKDAKSMPAASKEERKRKATGTYDELIGGIWKDAEEGKIDITQKYRKISLQALFRFEHHVKSRIDQARDLRETGPRNPHIWLWGSSGHGKSSIMNFVYPTYYKKNLYNKVFDLYNPHVHTHTMLEDLDYEAVKKLSFNFIKTLCDPQGFAIDKKHQATQLTRTTVLVTSQFQISDLAVDGVGIEEQKEALYRRFWHVSVSEFL
ncbi:hypothetical protein Poli38472_012804 [Pythium oligandrum]|uniref:Uncharacterized protein n=1 Tax=Pythium oligandrum TaxID=41045 RepID=A0A8K1CKY9_PYTOL|nr:hypothetical protein Poli38472_012804 [Pythium oligandrum]|eukprot:TMW64182.1 hypothetical protein Poli38472_012804 [Pythium oligandrum]